MKQNKTCYHTNKIVIRTLLILMIMVISGLTNSYSTKAASAVNDESTVDFVLVLDCSGTMEQSDPGKLTVAAAKMFVDMLPHKNARVAIVNFGADYGENAYNPEKYSNYVSVPFPLTDISSLDRKEICKRSIGDTSPDGYSPIGYAFQAACDILQEGGATPDDAGILLISDFRVTGQDDSLDDGFSFKSLEEAEGIAAKNRWPVYTMEMNFDGWNDRPEEAGPALGKAAYTARVANRIRSLIPERVGYGEYVPMESASEAQDKFAQIFKNFFDPNNNDESQTDIRMTDENGDATFQFSVGEMVAEMNVTLTCDDSSAIRSIEVGAGDNLAYYDLSSYRSPIQENDRTITKEDKYITIKLMVPTPDDKWSVVVHGSANTALGMYALSIHDMNFQLMAKTDMIDEETGAVLVGQGGAVQFVASYIYDNHSYSSEKVYSSYPAVLQVMETGEQAPMTPGTSNYSAELSFDNSGTYTVKAIVSGSAFRTGSIETGEYKIVVKNLLTVATDKKIDAQTLEPGGSVEITCSDYFVNPDGDTLTYQVTSTPSSSDLSCVPDGEKLKITAGKTAGSFDVSIKADDGNTPNDEDIPKQEFHLDIVNRPLELVNGDKKDCTFALDKDSIPAFFERLVPEIRRGEGDTENGEIRIEWEDCFSDPDGYAPEIQVSSDNPDGVIIMEQDESGMTLQAEAPGKASFIVTAKDANDSTVQVVFQVNASATSAKAILINKLRIPAIIILIVLILIFVFLVLFLTGRKVYGIWDVGTVMDYRSDMRLSSLRSGKKKTSRLGAILDDLGLDGAVDDAVRSIVLTAGSRFSKTVAFSNFSPEMEVERNGVPVDSVDPKTRIVINEGGSIRISVGGQYVELSRH